MTTNLVRALHASHLAGREPHASKSAPAAGAEIALRIDHVALDEDDGLLALLALSAARHGRIACPLALVALERNGLQAGPEVMQEQRTLEHAARAAGATLSRYGNGTLAGVYAARFAAPGRTVLGPRGRLAGFGAFAMLAGSAGVAELAMALAGEPNPTRMPDVVGVWLRGSLPRWAGGTDVALELARRATAGGPMLRVYEFTGPGVASMSMDDRLAAARGAARWCGGRAVFPSDAVTRAYLLAQQRESDWRAIESPPDAEYDREIELDLSALEPQVAASARGLTLAIGAIAGEVVDGVALGGDAGIDDLRRVARRLAGGRVADGTRLVVIPGTRQVRESLALAGALRTLEEAGAEIVDPGEAAAALRAAESARWVGYGVPVGGAYDHDPGLAYIAGPDVCAASALAGALRDPREGDPLPADDIVAEVVVDDARIARSTPADGDAVLDDPPPPPRLMPPLDRALRGVVLLVVAGSVARGAVLPWGARTRPLRSRPAELASHAFSGVDPDFAARARANGGGFVVWRGTFDSAARGDEAARVLVELGVRAVIALAYTESDRRALLLDGVLPLRPHQANDVARLEPGDELELPDVPDALSPRKPLVLRDLTRGSQLALRHDLSEREIAIVRAGGLLRWLSDRVPAVPEVA